MSTISLILIFACVVTIVVGIYEIRTLPAATQPRRVPRDFAVTLSLVDPDPDHPLRFSASGTASIYTSEAAPVLVFLRQLEIQSESYLDYLYNPF